MEMLHRNNRHIEGESPEINRKKKMRRNNRRKYSLKKKLHTNCEENSRPHIERRENVNQWLTTGEIYRKSSYPGEKWKEREERVISLRRKLAKWNTTKIREIIEKWNRKWNRSWKRRKKLHREIDENGISTPTYQQKYLKIESSAENNRRNI